MGHGVRVTPATFLILDSDFATAEILDNCFGKFLGSMLCIENTGCPLSSAFFHCPIIAMLDDISVVLCHDNLLLDHRSRRMAVYGDSMVEILAWNTTQFHPT